MAATTSGRNFLDIKDINALYDRAKEFVTSGFSAVGRCATDYALCRWFYRNKSPAYFQEILDSREGIMEVELKDASGDPGSPINGRISGVFFMASVERGSVTGEPMRKSPFGSSRLLVPVDDLLNSAPKLYFADFYCMTKTGYHCVTLVMTAPGSEADKFCAQYLKKLDNWNSPFLLKDKSGQLLVTTRDSLIVEIFYTEKLRISDYVLKHNIQVIGKGSSTPGGIPKNKYCAVCNLEPQV